MKAKKEYLASSMLFFFASLCFSIAAYADFYNHNYPLGILALIATILGLNAAIINYRKFKSLGK